MGTNPPAEATTGPPRSLPRSTSSSLSFANRTLTPVVKVVRFVVLGLVAIFIVGLTAVLFAVGVVRVLDTEVFHRHVWASYLVVGGIFSLAGLFLRGCGIAASESSEEGFRASHGHRQQWDNV